MNSSMARYEIQRNPARINADTVTETVVQI
jgi:hypothetical protein